MVLTNRHGSGTTSRRLVSCAVGSTKRCAEQSSQLKVNVLAQLFLWHFLFSANVSLCNACVCMNKRYHPDISGKFQVGPNLIFTS